MREAALELSFRIDELAGPFGLGSDEHKVAGEAARALNAEVDRLLDLLRRLVDQAPIDYDLMNNDPEWREVLKEARAAVEIEPRIEPRIVHREELIAAGEQVRLCRLEAGHEGDHDFAWVTEVELT